MELCRVAREVDAPADAIWALLADFGAPQVLARTIEACELHGHGVGAVRVISARGLSIHERLLELDEAKLRMRYEILDSGDMPAVGMTAYLSTVQLRPISADRTHIDWSCEGAVDGPPEAVQAQVAALYAQGISNLEAEARARAA
jgi:carbon monoxide dehydrogenase subunit G